MPKVRRRWLSKMGIVKGRASKSPGETPPVSNCGVVIGQELAVVAPSNVAGPSCSRTLHNDELDVRKRVWNRAYEKVLEEDPKLVQRYEKILEKLSGGITAESALQTVSTDVSETGDRPHRWDLMEQSIKVGLKRTETEAKAKGRMEQMMSSIQSVTELVERSVHACREVAFVWAGVCFAMEILTNPVAESEAQRKGLQYINSKMAWYWHLSTTLLSDDTSHANIAPLRQQMEDNICRLYSKLLAYQMKCVFLYHQNRVAVAFRDFVKYDDWEEHLEAIRSAEEEIRQDSSQYSRELEKHSSMHVVTALADVRDHKIRKEDSELCRLVSGNLPFYTKLKIKREKGHLITALCEWFFGCNEFLTWRDDSNSRVLWVKADPGKGKTMLACSILEWFQDSRPLSYFFCKETDASLNNHIAILRGLIFTIVNERPGLLTHVRERRMKLGLDGEVSEEALLETLEAILCDPMMDDAIVVIDALDECEKEGAALFLDVLERLSRLSRVKWILTSRNNFSLLHDKLSQHPLSTSVSLEEYKPLVADAVKSFVDIRLDEIWRRQAFDLTQKEDIRNELVSKADGTFLWVSLVFRDLNSAESGLILDADDLKQMIREKPKGLQPLYESMAKKLRASRHSDVFKDILSTVYIAYRPLTLCELSALAESPKARRGGVGTLSILVRQCGSFLTLHRDGKEHDGAESAGRDVVMFVHQSAKDFLLHTKASHETGIIPLTSTIMHRSALCRSLAVLREDLKRNMYGLLQSSDTLENVETPNPDPLRLAEYSCIHWISHLIHAACLKDGFLKNDVYLFLQEFFLYWIEALTLLRRLFDGLTACRKLKLWSERATAPKLSSWVQDGIRFLTTFKPIMESMPLQVYCSALLFSPTRSLIKSQNIDKEAPKLFHSLSGIRQNWDPCFLTIETGETGLHIDKMVFSKDDQQLIAWSDVCVQVWSVSTGTFIRQFPKQDTHAQICVSRNGDKCAWLDPHSGRLMIGDTATGDTFEIDMRPDPIAVQSVPAFFHNIEFSDDAKLLRIYTEIDGNWTIVDVQQEMCLCTISSLEPGKRTGTYITFVGSSYLVISHLESEFHVWDVRSGVPMGKIEAKAPLRRLSGIPSDSTRVISMSDDTLQIWDLKKMICLKDIPIQHSDFLKFALSDYGKTLAIRGVTDTMLNIWDLDSLTHTLSLDITVNEVRLSPKGDILATTSIEDESRIALWDTNSGSQLYELDEVSRTSQRAFSFSHNGHYMAMMSSHFIKVHDVAHMSKPVMHKDHRGYCGARLASSNDGQWVALALPRQRLVLLNGTGVNYELLTGGEGDSRSSSRIQPAFSSDSNRIAAHCGAKMNLWSLVPSSPPSRTVFDCNFDALDASSCFSKDLNYFATATASELIIWDTKAGMVLSQRNLQDLPFDQASNQKSYHSLCFVKGGSCLAITGDSGSIIVLDSTTAGVLFSNRNLMPAISRILSNTSNGNEHLVGLYGSSLKIWVISDNFSLMEKCSLETAEDVLLSHGKQSLLWRSLETINLDDEHLQDLSRKLIFDLNPPYMLGQSCKSIIRHGKHLVWVPPEYRPPLHSGSVCEGSRMVMVSSTGMVLDIVFADEILD